MSWLVTGAQPNDSLFFHCMFFFYLQIGSWSLERFFQFLDMAAKRRIRVATKQTDMMKVFKQHPPCRLPRSDMPSPVIYPVDFKKAGNIVDDVCYVHLCTCFISLNNLFLANA